MQILSDWINPNAAINYNGYNSAQIVLGLCAIEPEKDPTACSFGYATADVVKQTFLKANELYGCTVGGGVWASYCDQANNYLITSTIKSTFDACSGQTTKPTNALTLAPTASPSTRVPTLSLTAAPTSLRTAAPTVPTVMPSEQQKGEESSINSDTITAAAVGAGIGMLLSAVGCFAYNKYHASRSTEYSAVETNNPFVQLA